ncbi:MAG: M23 family metallopeptidase, partial [Acidimicrobiia bacterium]|nr:M23 family metallopeptidase [Acidimicrobiia bacterium]
GEVTFSGTVAGNTSITVSHGAGIRTSYSFLSARIVETGDVVGTGDIIGRSGVDRGRPALHFSLRVGDRYLDPLSAMACDDIPRGAVYLVPGPVRTRAAYPHRRASRHPRRDVRPAPSGTSRSGQRRPPSARPRRRVGRAGRRALAEGQSARVGCGAPLADGAPRL